MDPITGAALLTGGANLLSGVFSANTSAQNTQEQIAASKQEQATQNAFTEQMSSTAYQRASQDMKAAGLNPMMMFGSGGPASTPAGSSIQAPMPQTTSPMANLGKAAESAVSTAVAAKTYDKMTQEIANLKTQQALTAAETKTEDERPDYVRQQTLKTADEASTIAQKLPAAQLEGTTARDVLNMPAWLRSGLVQAGFAGSQVDKAISPATDIFNTLTNSALRKRGLDMLQERANQSAHSTEHYDVRPGGYTRSTESWRQ